MRDYPQLRLTQPLSTVQQTGMIDGPVSKTNLKCCFMPGAFKPSERNRKKNLRSTAVRTLSLHMFPEAFQKMLRSPKPAIVQICELHVNYCKLFCRQHVVKWL
jgi:hypothetical protein